jgi:hypothetical protein
MCCGTTVVDDWGNCIVTFVDATTTNAPLVQVRTPSASSPSKRLEQNSMSGEQLYGIAAVY